MARPGHLSLLGAFLVLFAFANILFTSQVHIQRPHAPTSPRLQGREGHITVAGEDKKTVIPKTVPSPSPLGPDDGSASISPLPPVPSALTKGIDIDPTAIPTAAADVRPHAERSRSPPPRARKVSIVSPSPISIHRSPTPFETLGRASPESVRPETHLTSSSKAGRLGGGATYTSETKVDIRSKRTYTAAYCTPFDLGICGYTFAVDSKLSASSKVRSLDSKCSKGIGEGGSDNPGSCPTSAQTTYINNVHGGVYFDSGKMVFAVDTEPRIPVCQKRERGLAALLPILIQARGGKVPSMGSMCPLGDSFHLGNSTVTIPRDPRRPGPGKAAKGGNITVSMDQPLQSFDLPTVWQQLVSYRSPAYSAVKTKTYSGKEAYQCLRRRLHKNTWMVFIGDSNTRDLFDAFVETIFPPKHFGGGGTLGSLLKGAPPVDANNKPWPADGKKRLQRSQLPGPGKDWTDRDVIATWGGEADAVTDAKRPGLRLSLRFLTSHDEKFERMFDFGTMSTIYTKVIKKPKARYVFEKGNAVTGQRWPGEKDGNEVPDLVSPNFGMWGWQSLIDNDDDKKWTRAFKVLSSRRIAMLGRSYRGAVLWRLLHAPKEHTKSGGGKVYVTTRRVLIANAIQTRQVREHYMVYDGFKSGLNFRDNMKDGLHFQENVYYKMAQEILNMICTED